MPKKNLAHLLMILTIFCAGMSVNQPIFSQTIGNTVRTENTVESSKMISPGEEKTPDSPDPFTQHRTLADRYRKSKDFNEAIREYQEALASRPFDMHSLFWLATLYRWTHQLDKAEESYRSILKDHPDDFDTKIGLAYVYRALGKNTEAKKIIKSVLAKHPNNREAKMFYARILESEGEINKASEIYLELATDRPDDALARSRSFRMRKRARPTVQLDIKDGRTRVLEGRGDPILVTRVEYLTDGIGLKSGVPLSDQLAFSAEFNLKDETLTLLEVDGKPRRRTIYDFETETGLFGTTYDWNRRWIFHGKIGTTRYKDQKGSLMTPGSIENRTVSRYELMVQFKDRVNTAAVQFRRAPLLGRSTGGELDFRIFTQTQGSLKYRRRIKKGLISFARFIVSDYSDDSRTYEISGGVRFQRHDTHWGITISKTSLQGRFLIKPGLNLEFIDVHTLRLDYDRRLKRAWQIIAYAQYRFFEDGNEEQQVVAEAIYSFQTVPWLSAGIEEEIDHFNRDAAQYSTRSIRTRTTGYLKVHTLWGSYWQTDLRAMLTGTDDEGDSFYGGHGVEAKIEYTLPFSVILGVEGKVERNALNDSRRKVVGFLLIIF